MASVSKSARPPGSKAKAVHRSVEQSVLLLCIIAGLPAGLALLALSWGQPYSFEVRWTITSIVLIIWIGSAAVAYQMVQRVLFLQANLRAAGYWRRSRHDRDQRPGRYAAAAAHRGGRVDQAAPECDGGDRRRGI